MREARLLAAFVPKGRRLTIEGYCENCLVDAPISFEDYKPWIGCPPCASIIADSMS